VRRLQERLEEVTGGASVVPLVLLFLLNFVDEFDQALFGVLAPNIRDTFDMTEPQLISLAAISGALVIILIVPIGVAADRRDRVKMATLAAFIWGVFTIGTGVAGWIGVVAVLFMTRFFAGLGRVMNEPVHASLLADYYDPRVHGRVFSVHRLANPIGLLSVLIGGSLAAVFGWQLTFVLIAIPTFVVVAFVNRLKEPVRGASINYSLAEQAEQLGGHVPIWEARRRLSAIPTLKRFYFVAFLLGAALVPITVFFAFFYEKVYGIEKEGVWGRAGILAIYGVGAIIGLLIGSRLSDRTIASGDLPKLSTLGGITLMSLGAALLLMSVAPWLGLSIFFTFMVGVTGSGFNSYHLPLVALVAPPRLRSQALGWVGFWFGMGAILLSSFVSGIGDRSGYRWGIGVLAVGVIIAGAIYLTVRKFIARDIQQAFQTLSTEVELKQELEQQGARALLTCKGVEVAYDQVQVLFGVDMEVEEGEIVALLGTNGAGKSTLLKAISGVVDALGGAMFFDGRDITHADANQTAKLGIVQVPGGKAVFPTLTVAEHLRAAGWLYRDDPKYLEQANEEVLEIFPRLRERIDQMAGNLSGGEQQMLALAMAFIAKPKLLMIDELSLGLAPAIVEQLLDIVRKIRDQGTAIILVEQSINVALTVAERAYFMEKGEVRFSGATSELLERDDIVRSVFLEGAAVATGQKAKTKAVAKSGSGTADEFATAPIALEVAGLSKRFGGITAVDDCDLVLRDGEILGLIGPNGAGKTTIFDLVSGFLVPDGGRIVLDGKDITDLAPDKRAWLGLGRSFQDARLASSLTVAENIAIGLERHLGVRDHVAAAMGLPGVVRMEEDVAWTVADLVDLMNLGAYRDKFVRELSTGTRRIVDLAMSIAHDPRVLLLDEPSSGIAQRETEALGPLLQRIRQEAGCALLVIEHDMPLITSVSNRIVALELGHPIAEGRPEDVVRDPRVVSSYLGGDMSVINRSGKAGAGTK
jgi:branched-chain amino acid transport system ATP-binding protein